jgi:molybdopterin-guanine dinucleotide biosynthesis protein A
MLQDERGKLTYAKEEGKITEAITLIMRQMKKRFGEIPLPITNQIQTLDLENLEKLGEDFLDFNSLEDLENWLERQ